MTKTVFLSGSRSIALIDDMIRLRLENMIESRLKILVGDADGADTAFQRYFAERNYDDVKIYCSGNTCRNNVGGWQTVNVMVPAGVRGREFYTVKDQRMAHDAEIGFVLWDGKSMGSANNIIELVKDGKIAVVFLLPDRSIVNLRTLEDFYDLIAGYSKSQIDRLRQNVAFDDYFIKMSSQ